LPIFCHWRYQCDKTSTKHSQASTKNSWFIKQYPKVNGGIVILDPFTGDILALVGGFNFKKSELEVINELNIKMSENIKVLLDGEKSKFINNLK